MTSANSLFHQAQPMHTEESTAAKEVPLSSTEQALHDELVSLMHQESLAKAHNDDQRIAFEEEKKRIALDKGKGKGTSKKVSKAIADETKRWVEGDARRISIQGCRGVQTRRRCDYDEVFAQVTRIEANLTLFGLHLFGLHCISVGCQEAFLYGNIRRSVCQNSLQVLKIRLTPNRSTDFQGTLWLHSNKRLKDRRDIMLVQVYVDDIILLDLPSLPMAEDFEDLMHKDNSQMSSLGELTFFLGLQVKAIYGGLLMGVMLINASRPDIMFAVCLCARFQVTPKVSHLLDSFSDSDYAGDNHDRRSTSGGCQYLGRRLVSWQCKKQTIVAISSTAEYVAAASCCAQDYTFDSIFVSGVTGALAAGEEHSTSPHSRGLQVLQGMSQGSLKLKCAHSQLLSRTADYTKDWKLGGQEANSFSAKPVYQAQGQAQEMSKFVAQVVKHHAFCDCCITPDLERKSDETEDNEGWVLQPTSVQSSLESEEHLKVLKVLVAISRPRGLSIPGPIQSQPQSNSDKIQAEWIQKKKRKEVRIQKFAKLKVSTDEELYDKVQIILRLLQRTLFQWIQRIERRCEGKRWQKTLKEKKATIAENKPSKKYVGRGKVLRNPFFITEVDEDVVPEFCTIVSYEWLLGWSLNSSTLLRRDMIEVDIIKKTENQAKMTKLSMEWKQSISKTDHSAIKYLIAKNDAKA
ncbi:hypothetical protein Tco_1056619 [Tanacetum coccineum]|uniref:Reverse transcriptase Ty1/copia-type domain-containing protein n=1 Tax=Tanacetum coccineum TaxID=301880 RepID=A0ABQ5H323_9ASTR